MNKFEIYELVENTSDFHRSMAGLFGYFLMWMVIDRGTCHLDVFGAFLGAIGIAISLFFAYAGLTQPILKTLIVAILVFGGFLLLGAGSMRDGMGSTVEARLDLDPTNPNYSRRHHN